MKKYTQNDAASDTGVSKSEVSSAWHQARNDAQRAGEILNKRNLSEKTDIPIKSENELQAIALNDKVPSQEQLEKWNNDQIEGVDYNSSIKIAEKIMNDEGEEFFNDNFYDSEATSEIQEQVTKEQNSTEQLTRNEKDPESQITDNTQSHDEGQKR